MFQNIFQTSAGQNATLEILIMLIGAFVLGYLACLIFRYSEDDYEEEEVVIAHEGSKTKIYRADDLTIIEGIGPKIQELLNDSGIRSYADLADKSEEALGEILKKAGSRYQMHEPKTWPKQARLASEGKFDDLADYQAFLFKGKDHL